MRRRQILLPSLVALAAGLPAQDSVSFERHVLPVLRARCFRCHGPEKPKGGLRLDRREAALQGGDSGEPAIVPGRSAESRLWRLINVPGDGKRMPLGETALAADDLARIREWIDAGASWPETAGAAHWAYVPPRRPPAPDVRDAAWPRGDLDRFVLARLEAEGLAPSPEADRATLLRRVHLDVLGLPPAPEDVVAFLADDRPDAWERMVDAALASPRRGERMARWWLDQARYADTNGYEKDLIRVMWPWRDWVIRAFNDNVPFDRFTVEQLAGDLLPGATAEQRLATGFHRNTMLNDEGGIDPEEFRAIAVVDRVNTTAAVWLGSTLACAQCHDHKYDPFTQREYFGLYAFFDQTEDDGRDPEPREAFPSADEARALEGLRAEIARLEAAIAEVDLDAARRRWEAEVRESRPGWTVLVPASVTSESGSTLAALDDGSVLASGSNPDNDVYTVAAEVRLPRLAGLRLEVLTHADLPHGGPGRNANGSFVLSAVEVEAAPAAGGRPPEKVVFHAAAADHTQEGHDVRSLIDGRPKPGWAIGAFQDGFRVDRTAVFESLAPPAFAGPARLTVRLKHAFGRGHNLGRFRLSATASARASLALSVPAALREAVARPGSERSEDDRRRLDAHFRSIAPETAALRRDLARTRDGERALLAKVPRVMVMRERKEPRATRIHARGDPRSPGDAVAPSTPAALPPLPDGEPRNRLGLARWLVSPGHPLAARVIANRLFELFFGRGLVPTGDDFGTRGEPPSHPELLDWLAGELVRVGWDVRAFQRTILLSATYRQASSATPALLAKDPQNRLLARGPRFRLEAEAVRDVALAASGLISATIGGPSVFPYQPEGIWEQSFTFHDTKERWIESTGDDAHRRTLYTFLRRTAPHPGLTTFDAGARETCLVSRGRTNTPLQALAALNDPAHVEAAVALARRMIEEGRGDARAALERGFLRCLSRRPSVSESRRLLALRVEALARYREDAAAALRLLGRGGSGVDPASAPEVASWTVVGSVLLNLDETLTKG